MGTNRDVRLYRCLAAMKRYWHPLTVHGIAEEVGIPVQHVPWRQMEQQGLIEIDGEIEGYVAWKLTNQKEND